MTEQKVKKRGWVKNAAIIFLAVLLVLTFFSNTIMNRSLPEVAAQGVQSGTISAKIRGTGTVTANESFEVKSEQTREVLSVPVKVGDEVAVGDTLVLYSDAESDDIKKAQDDLYGLILNYKLALVDASDPDYADYNRKIELAQKSLDDAQEALNKARDKLNACTKVTDADITKAQQNLKDATSEYDKQQDKVTDLSTELSGLSSGTDNSDAIDSKLRELNEVQDELDAMLIAYEDDYGNLKKCTASWQDTAIGSLDSIYIDALAKKYTAALNAYDPFPDTPEKAGLPAFPSDVTFDKDTISRMLDAYNVIHPLQVQIATLNEAIIDLKQGTGADWNYYLVKNGLTEAKNKLTKLETAKDEYDTALTDLKQKKTDYETNETAYETADDKVGTCQNDLEEAMFNLAEQKKKDGKQEAKDELNFADQQRQIEEQEEELAKLKKGGQGASVESQVNGIVASVNTSAGKTANADDVLMTIEVPDMGYGISFSVTTEQSKKVALGDPAEISNYWSSNQISATLVGIKNDPQNPMTNKILSFKLQGDVESGTQLSISIGEKGSNYETLVPNSAIRSDNNGKFVLVVTSKNSPLGNRYIATRIDVKVLATDDVNSAVSGGLSSGDFVITTSSKPVEPGTQVRLADQA